MLKVEIELPSSTYEFFRQHNCCNDKGWVANEAILIEATRKGRIIPEIIYVKENTHENIQ